MKYRKKPVVVEAHQWFKNGDHPQDEATEMASYPNDGRPIVIREGKIVRYFRHPLTPGDSLCNYCQRHMSTHGWIDTLECGHIVCPGDFVITGVQGERYPCKPDIFAATYEPVDSSPAPGPTFGGFFSLDLETDPYAPAAMRAYASACRRTDPELSKALHMRFASGAEQLIPKVDVPDVKTNIAGENRVLSQRMTMHHVADQRTQVIIEELKKIRAELQRGRFSGRAIEQSLDDEDNLLG